ncbi:MAG: type II toxin-antitoxin system HicA family toxin [bacterium]|nr:type II toxin-antitoxin system HicA family toxin [bacterium]
MTGFLPSLTSKDMLRALQKAGFSIHHQSGSHIILRNGDKRVTLPMHNVDLHKGIIKSILNQAGMTAETLKELL